jgi:hypothetical protein
MILFLKINNEISPKDIIYSLKLTSNKRKHIYIDGVLQKTEPYFYHEIANK